jgi:hypothetical protein
VATTKLLSGWMGDLSFGLVEKEAWCLAVRDGISHILTTWQDGRPQYTARHQFNGQDGMLAIRVEGVTQLALNVYQLGENSLCDIYEPEVITRYIKDSHGDWALLQAQPGEPNPIPRMPGGGNGGVIRTP